ncbi:MAG TPA: class I SAM-dependent methyltransferase [Solirubrobacteraceae bacterium]|nr:class I SAM-dependent methyltransferase [Solirubrobacteraceae bacterium]
MYELGGATAGPILELGTYQGKSTTLLALGAGEAGRESRIFSLDVNPVSLQAARSHAVKFGVADRIVFFLATAFARACPAFRPALTFLDADHSQPAVERDLQTLHAMVPEGAMLWSATSTTR